MAKNKLSQYFGVFAKRLYAPIRPIADPLVNLVKVEYWLILILGLMLASNWYQGGESRLTVGVKNWPWSARARADLALAWFEAGEEQKAIEILEEASRLGGEIESARVIIAEPQKIRDEIASWEEILVKKPYYRDVLIRLAVLNYQIRDDESAKHYWDRAFWLDPKLKPLF